MLCSTSTSAKSTSNWLDRLRSSKGFPTDLDLDQYLTHQHDSISPNPPESDPKPSTKPAMPQIQNPSEGKQLFTLMSNVLAELFIMGDSSSNLPHKKCSRKQANPKFCVPLNSSDFSNNYDNNNSDRNNEDARRKNDSASPLSDDNSGVGLVKESCGDEQVKLVENVNCGAEEEEEEKGFGNLSGFSRTEVTVIDTSFARWKFEKMLFRKKNVWRVRDIKKGKMLNCGNKKKKRNSSDVATGNVCGGEAKKPKVLDAQCGLSNKGTERQLQELLSES